ncbi:MAG: hypothetical protein ACOC1I_03285 [Spirochaetota bacterium]
MYRLFVDLDGVLVDFESGVKRVTGRLPHEQTQRSMWSQLARTDGFYEHLDWTRDGRELWEALKEHEPTILTGLPLGRWAEPQKRAWCARELGPGVPVITCMSRNKAKRAREVTPPDATPVLVDDREWLRDRWEEMGGVFVHHTDAASSIERVNAIMRRGSARPPTGFRRRS